MYIVDELIADVEKKARDQAIGSPNTGGITIQPPTTGGTETKR